MVHRITWGAIDGSLTSRQRLCYFLNRRLGAQFFIRTVVIAIFQPQYLRRPSNRCLTIHFIDLDLLGVSIDRANSRTYELRSRAELRHELLVGDQNEMNRAPHRAENVHNHSHDCQRLRISKEHETLNFTRS